MPTRTASPTKSPEPRLSRPIRLLIVDDSAVARAVFARIVGTRPEFEIAACVSGADAALAFLRSAQVDIILLDIEMPGLDGLTALPSLIEASRGARVLIVSSSAEEGAVATIRALTLGAADTLAKPGSSAFGGQFASVLTEKLRRLGHARELAPGERAQPRPHAELTLRPLAEGRVGCVAIGASTGGLHALSDLLRALPADFGAPILITQHLPASFMGFFAAQIAEMARRRTQVAREGMKLMRGQILVAPGEGHLGIDMVAGAPRVRITDERVESGCMPSVDPMLASVAAVFGVGAVGVVLSGMGRDGLRGAGHLAAAGADVVVQTRETSVVWGMPGAVACAGLASAVLPPAQIASLIAGRDRGAA